MNDTKIVTISILLNSHLAISTDDAKKVYNFIKLSLKNNKNIIISFKGIDTVITVFPTILMTLLYKKFGVKFIENKVKFIDLPEIGEELLTLIKKRLQHLERDKNESSRTIN